MAQRCSHERGSTVPNSDDGIIYLSFPSRKTEEVDTGAKIISK